MKIRINGELFEHNIYNLEIINKELIFTSEDEKKIIILLNNIKQIIMEGPKQGMRHFIIETNDTSIDGNFIDDLDAEQLLILLKTHLDFYMELRLDCMAKE